MGITGLKKIVTDNAKEFYLQNLEFFARKTKSFTTKRV